MGDTEKCTVVFHPALSTLFAAFSSMFGHWDEAETRVVDSGRMHVNHPFQIVKIHLPFILPFGKIK